MGLLIFYAIISIFFSFLCSILEAVLLSITPTFINVKKTGRQGLCTGTGAPQKGCGQAPYCHPNA